jgi:excisionase family DNA binding protein
MAKRETKRAWLTSGEVARRLGVSKRTVQRLAEAGEIAHTWSLGGEARTDKRGATLRGHRHFAPAAVAAYERRVAEADQMKSSSGLDS